MFKKYKRFFISAILSTALPFLASAEEGKKVTLPNPIGAENIYDLLKNIVGFMIWIAAPIAAGIIIYGAYLIMFARGNAQMFQKGKETILYAFLGYAIILIGWGFVNIIAELLGQKK